MLRVLAVDDEPPALAELAYLLRANPQVSEVLEAGDGVATLRALNRALAEGRPVDAVFLDIRMSALDGLMVAAVLAGYPRAPQVVFVTAYEESAVEASELGAADYLLKPVRPARLAMAVQRVVAAAGAPPTPRPGRTGLRQGGELPVERTPLVGRAREQAAVVRLLTEARTVTLTGVGGVGKSRLAVRVADTVRPNFPDGVYLVELAGIADGSLLPHAIAMELQVPDEPTRPMVELLADRISDRRLLLVLDGCDRFVEAAADLVTLLLRAAPQLTVLCTTRQTLDLPGEQVMVVPPLDVAPDGPAHASAVALFAERAAAASPGFVLTPDTEPLVTRVCARLEGIPLAIELAAARLRELTLTDLDAGIADRFALLTHGAASAPPRHRTLRAAIGWSHELCAPPERLLWARLSVFPADFDLAEAEAVCADEQLPADTLFDHLSQLISKSVLTGVPNPDGMRYRMLDTVREYGQDWLDALGERETLRVRHLNWCLQSRR